MELELLEIDAAADNLFKKLDIVNELIKATENKLEKIGFEYEIYTNQINGSGSWIYIGWVYNPDQRKNRLCIINKSPTGRNEGSRPFLECKLDERLKYIEFIPMFLAEFRKFIIDKTHAVDNAIFGMD
jgi:hypothetical protein